MSDLDKLLEISSSQHGIFTSKQAIECGYPKRDHANYCKRGKWIRKGRGVFALPDIFDNSMSAELTVLSMWSRNQKDQPQGVISHQTALAVHGLAEYDGGEVHMTVPAGFRKKADSVVALHRESLTLSAIESRDGFMVTRPVKTLSDVRRDLSVAGRWKETVDAALTRKMLSSDDMKTLDIDSGEFSSNGEAAENSVVDAASVYIREKDGIASGNAVGAGVLDSDTKGVWQMIFERSAYARRRSQAGFTLVELLVVIAIISILAAMLLPALEKSMASARQIKCAGNLKQMNIAMLAYASDYNSLIPPLYGDPVNYRPFWLEPLEEGEYLTKQVFHCPAMPKITTWPYTAHYGINSGLYYASGSHDSPSLDQANTPSKKLFILDSSRNAADGSSNDKEGFCYVSLATNFTNVNHGRPGGRHLQNCNTLWLDGHVSSIYVHNPDDPYVQFPFRYTGGDLNYIHWNNY